MRLLTFDELTPRMDLDRTLIHLSAFGGVFSARTVDLLRRRTNSLADYVGVFAVEGPHVLGQVFVLRVPYAFREGRGVLSGIAGVGTRPDRGRTGIARSLLTEVHRREREAGQEYAALWTNRSWGAHALYEQLGYRDVYAIPWAVHAPEVASGRDPHTKAVHPGKRSDLAEVDLLHDRVCGERLGFYRRPEGSAEADARAGLLDPAQQLIVARRKGRLVGYAYIDSNSRRVICGELVAGSRLLRHTLIRAVRSAANALPFAFQHTLVSDTPGVFRPPEYATVQRGWYVLMGHALRQRGREDEAIRQFAVHDPSFVCLAGDRF